MTSFDRFPWRIFWKFFLHQAIAFNALFLVLIWVLDTRYHVRAFIYNEALLNFFVFSLLVAAVVSYRFTRPIHKLIKKALRVSSKRYARTMKDNDEENLLDDDIEEYVELDLALNRMQRKMKRKKEQLAQEREEAQAFMSSVQEGLISVSPEQKILYFNSQFAAQFLDPAQMGIVGLSLKDIFRIPEILEGFEKVYHEGKVHRFTIKLNTRIENQARYFAVSVNPLRKSQSREVYGIIGIFHDITDLKKTEQVRIDFVGNASHELRTPLTAVKGYVETLREDIKTGHFDQAEKFVGIISRNVDRLIDLVNDLLSLSTLESGSELKLEQVSPLQISEHVVSELMVLASEKNQSIRVIGEVPPFMADARKVEQVLRNLVSNSVKYIPAGGTVQIRWENDAHDHVLLRVIDDGPGIPDEHHDRLFERFYRIDKGRTRDAGGTGLGLAIVKHIMQSHGGTVTIKNGLDKGAEFICTFPKKS
jgi:two-component system phosphate regulon sensor histidine kinase PhoR